MQTITIVPDSAIRSNLKTSLNRICDVSEWQADGALSNVMRQLGEGVYIHRKAWEYAICVHGLTELGVVRDNARAIAVGAGSERPLFYFANVIEEMVATDLYDDPEHEGQPAMLTNPENFAPFEYRRDHLTVKRMSGTHLEYPDNTFDFAFTLSSIEHFGSRDAQRQAMSEMRRVVKPNGVICVATELILNNATHHEYFTLDELRDVIINTPGLSLTGGDLDLRVSRSLFENPIQLDVEPNLNVSPHIVITAGGVIWTSIVLFFRVDEKLS